MRSSATFFSPDTEKPELPYHDSAQSALDNAANAGKLALPTTSILGAMALFAKPNGDAASLIAPFFKMMGFGMMVAGPVIDVVKLPVSLIVATEELLRSGILTALACIFEKNPDDQMRQKLSETFHLRLKHAIEVVHQFNLEPAEITEQKLQKGDVEDYVALALLDTCYESRHLVNVREGLILGNHKLLKRKYCPAEGLALFDKMIELSENISAGLELINPDRVKMSDLEERELADMKIVSSWLKVIKDGLPLDAAEYQEVEEGHIKQLNIIINLVAEIKEMAMPLLPKLSIASSRP